MWRYSQVRRYCPPLQYAKAGQGIWYMRGLELPSSTRSRGRDRTYGWALAQTPACGPTALGSCLGSDVETRAGERCNQHSSSPRHPPGVTGLAAMPRSIRQSVRCVYCQPVSPRLTSFPPPPPQLKPCSTGSSVLRGDTTSHVRASIAFPGRHAPDQRDART